MVKLQKSINFAWLTCLQAEQAENIVEIYILYMYLVKGLHAGKKVDVLGLSFYEQEY